VAIEHTDEDKLAGQRLNGLLEPLTRRVIARLGLEEAERLASDLKGLAAKTSALMEEPWARALSERQLTESAAMSRLRPTALAFLSEARQLVDERAAFVGKPVSLSTELPPKPQRDYILHSLAEGKNPFGLFAFMLKAHQQVINQIRVSGLPPAGTDDWRHVCIFVAFRDKIMSLSARWIPLRDELFIPEEVRDAGAGPIGSNRRWSRRAGWRGITVNRLRRSGRQ
jgi:hypothetical protein